MNPYFYQEYLRETQTPSDIFEHLPLLYNLGKEVNSITELGVGYGRSTRTFVAAIAETGGTLDSYDIKELPGVADIFTQATNSGLKARFHLQSTLEANILETDLMLVDSHHTYDQVKGELLLHAPKVSKYILFHDIVTFGPIGQDPGSIGIMPAIDEWLSFSPEWQIFQRFDNCNGMLVCKRQ